MIDEKKKDTFDTLKPEDRLFVLICMKEAIHSGLKKLLVQKTYLHFKNCLHSDQEFDPADIWNALPKESRDHFNHSFEYLQTIVHGINNEMAVLQPKRPPGTKRISRRGKGKKQ